MHICFLTHEYPPMRHGGVGTFTQTMARSLVQEGHKVSVIGVCAVQEKSLEDDHGVSVIRLAQSHASLPFLNPIMNHLKLWLEILALNRKSPIAVIEGPELSFGLLPPLPPSMVRLIRMQGGHHFFSTTLGKKPLLMRSLLERLSFARANAYCAISNFLAKETMNLLGLSHKPVQILPNPVDTTKFNSLDAHQQTSEAKIVFMGTVTRKKGVFELVEAMRHITREIPNACLWIIGRDHQNTIAALQENIPPEAKDKIVFCGAVPHEKLPELLSDAALCVFPSYMEGQGIVVIEGMSMGKAVVASQTGPGPELIEHGITGLLCNPYEPQSIAEQIIRLLKDENLRFSIGQAARQKVEECFSIEILTHQNIEFYEKLIRATKEKARAL